MFVGEGDAADGAAGLEAAHAYDAEHAGLTLADVAGMTEVKQRLEAAFLAPMRNPDLRRLYGKSLRGGLLLYGPPGCGKTFIARAVAGELGARFISGVVRGHLDMFVGQSERNIHELFEARPRATRPCVLFLDEIDALGQKRIQLRHTPMRSAVNQLLPSSTTDRRATTRASSCWPPRTIRGMSTRRCADRAGSTGPCWSCRPTAAAREAVFRYHLRDRPVAGIDLARLATQTDGYSGADIAHVCETAAERALMDSVRRGKTADDRTRRPRSRDRRGQAVARPVVRHRPQRGAVRQRGRQLRRPGRLPAQAPPAVIELP